MTSNGLLESDFLYISGKTDPLFKAILWNILFVRHLVCHTMAFT